MSIEFKTDSAAFEEGDAWQETARILREIAEALERTEDNGIIRDSNGNTIGRWSL